MALHARPFLQLLNPLTLFSRQETNVTSSNNDSNGTSSVSIELQPAFSSQDACGRGCIYNTDTAPAARAINLQFTCSSNECYCATASSNLYSSFVSSCMTYACSIIGANDPSSTLPGEISTALAIYDAYCSTAFPQAGGIAASTTPLPTTSPTTTPPTTSPPSTTSPVTTLPPSTTSPIPSPTPSNHLSPGAIGGIAGGVTGGVLLGVLISALFLWTRSRRRKQASTVSSTPWQPEQGQKAELAATMPTQMQNKEVNPIHQHEATELDTSSRVLSPTELDYMPYRAELEGGNGR